MQLSVAVIMRCCTDFCSDIKSRFTQIKSGLIIIYRLLVLGGGDCVCPCLYSGLRVVLVFTGMCVGGGETCSLQPMAELGGVSSVRDSEYWWTL